MYRLHNLRMSFFYAFALLVFTFVSNKITKARLAPNKIRIVLTFRIGWARVASFSAKAFENAVVAHGLQGKTVVKAIHTSHLILTTRNTTNKQWSIDKLQNRIITRAVATTIAVDPWPLLLESQHALVRGLKEIALKHDTIVNRTLPFRICLKTCHRTYCTSAHSFPAALLFQMLLSDSPF